MEDEHSGRHNEDLHKASRQDSREFGARVAASVCPARYRRRHGAKAKTDSSTLSLSGRSVHKATHVELWPLTTRHHAKKQRRLQQ